MVYDVKEQGCRMLKFPFYCSDVLQRDTNNADAVYVRALCLYCDDNIDKAVNFFVHALRLSPDLTKARLTLQVGCQPFLNSGTTLVIVQC